MKTLRFHFCHPVIGRVRLIHQNHPENKKLLAFETKDDMVATIPTDQLPSGKWTAVLEWENDGMDYTYSKTFVVGAAVA